MARMKDYYKQEVAPALMKKFSYKSVMQIPKLEKVVVNVGEGDARDNAKVIDSSSPIFPPSPVRSRSSARRESRSPTSSSVRA